jgi:hypothetical protein
MEVPTLVQEFKDAAGENWQERAKAAKAAGADTYAKLMDFATAEPAKQEALL